MFPYIVRKSYNGREETIEVNPLSSYDSGQYNCYHSDEDKWAIGRVVVSGYITSFLMLFIFFSGLDFYVQIIVLIFQYNP